MGNSPSKTTSGGIVPPPQRNLDSAAAAAWAAVRSQAGDQLNWLGATLDGSQWKLPVLNDVLSFDLEQGRVQNSAARAVGPWWQVLSLHYLGVAGRPDPEAPSVTFADLTGGRGYVGVYQKRVIHRLCRTAASNGDRLRGACRTLGALVVRDPAGGIQAADAPPTGDLVLDFRVFPRVGIRLTWYAGDEELPPSAAMLLPGNIASFFCVEDIVVLSERLVSRLEGGQF